MEGINDTIPEKPHVSKLNVFASMIILLIVGIGFGMLFQYYRNAETIRSLNAQLVKQKNSTNTQAINTIQDNDQNPCGSNDGYNLRFTNIRDWCEVRVLYDWEPDFGYSLTYPKNWTVQLRGAGGTNLSLHKEDKELVFVRVARSDLNFDLYDTVKQGYEQSEPVPIVNTNDKVNSKETVYIGIKKLMKLETTSDDSDATYYLFDNGLQKDKSIFSIRVSKEVTSEEALTLVKSFLPRYTY